MITLPVKFIFSATHSIYSAYISFYTKVPCVLFHVETMLMFLGASENNKGSLDFKTVAVGAVVNGLCMFIQRFV